jgi:antitoxin component of MazEF toxin-antitoxin module
MTATTSGEKVIVRRFGRSLYLRISPFIAQKMGVDAGDAYVTDFEGKRIVYAPTRRDDKKSGVSP